MPGHKFYNQQQSLEIWPDLNPKVLYTATYYDGAMPSPERICMELISDAQADSDTAWAVNYMQPLRREGNRMILRDNLSGEEFSLQPKVVVNAAGPWIDIANLELGVHTNFIGGTKGSHLIIDHPRLRAALRDHEFFFEYFDGRIVLINPYLDKVMIGTTDIRIDDPDQARCTEEEIEYMLNMIPHVFPDMDVSRDQIVFQFSGVRPLPEDTKDTPGQISRDHRIEHVEPYGERKFPILNLVSGKWTTFRAFGEDVTDEVLELLGLERLGSTADLPIGGGRDYPPSPEAVDGWIRQLANKTGLAEDRVRILFERYGTGAEAIASYMISNTTEPLKSDLTYAAGEVAYLARHENVVNLDDFLLRRSLIAWRGEVSLALLNELANVIGGVLGWDAEVVDAQVVRAMNVLCEVHGMEVK